MPGHNQGPATGQYMRIAKGIEKMSGTMFRKSLIRAGIITEQGALQAKYKKK